MIRRSRWVSLEERFRACVSPDSATGCHNWTGYVSNYGYGKITREGRSVFAHRIAYELGKGPIPDGLVIDHLCRNRRCCNPDHLEAVTHGENCLRGFGAPAVHARMTHCALGHELDGKNSGGRYCKTCRRAKRREQHHAWRLDNPPKRMGNRYHLKTHCPRGHPYDVDNTRICRGKRYCRACEKLRKRVAPKNARRFAREVEEASQS